MLADDMYALRGNLSDKGIMFCYSGYMTEEILTGIGHAIKKKLELEETDRKTVRRLFGIFVEQMQNVIRYSAEGALSEHEGVDKKDDLRFGLLLVGEQNNKFFVSCANLIKHDDVDQLKHQLAHIQTLERGDLMKLYKQILKGDTPEGSKGAGVGFIDIARLARNGFEFDFTTTDGGYSYFCLKAYI